MTEKEIEIITQEDYQNEESAEQKIIFDNNIFEQVKGKELDLSVEKVLEVPTIKNWFLVFRCLLFTRFAPTLFLHGVVNHQCVFVIICGYSFSKNGIPNNISFVVNSYSNLEVNNITFPS